jgi:hypothetical protein
LSVSAYINSVIKSQTEFFIPLASAKKVAIPKGVLYSLFSYASKDSLDDLVSHWGVELKHAVQLIWGEQNLQTSLDAISKVSKYLMGTEARVITISNFTKDTDYKEGRKLSKILNYSDGESGINYTSIKVWIIIRHNLGENCSYFWNRMFIQFLGNLKDSVDFITEYDGTTISIRLKAK